MKRNQFWTAVSKALAVMTVTLIMALMLAPGAWAASTYKILHAFRRLYGTTQFGGSSSCGCGVVFKLAPNPDGTWTEHVLHAFLGYGANPLGSQQELLRGASGNLYGTASGGTSGGLVFEIKP